MTQTKARRGELSPSLFPFLAVLLCTVGALVLILVLVVGQSQAAVKEAVDTREERREELRAQVETVRDSFKADRERLQLEIEKKRMHLQGLEKQTSDLARELEDLSKTAELIDKQLTTDESTDTLDESLTELQKQLQDAAEKLKTKLDQPANEKPVFAIIPYEGTSGTHRRPIYLECRADGIVIQPEGVLLPLKDLKPPYGPGNPLDAALRTARQHYAPKDGALNSSAYPLLVVRSSGIRTYALARMAMAGWDDQFGYELIEDDMELAFPEGEPSLGKELEQSLVTARSRQAALVMAMPGRYRRVIEELSDDQIRFDEGGESWSGDEVSPSSDAAQRTDLALAGNRGNDIALGGQPGGANYPGGLKPGGLDSESGTGFPNAPAVSGDPNALSMNMPGGRGGFAFAPDGSRGASHAGPPGGQPYSSGGGGGMQGFATGGDAADNHLARSGGQALAGSDRSPSAWNSSGENLGTNSGEGSQSFAEGAFSGNQYTRGGQAGGRGSRAGGEGGGELASSTSSGNATASSATRPGTFRDAMAAARSKQQGSADSQSSQSSNGASGASAAATGTGGSQIASPRSEGFGSISANGNEINAQSPTISPTADLSRRKKNLKEDAEAVAKSKGRNWAWSAGPARETAIVRTIRVVCYEDRWLVLPDKGVRGKPQTIMLDVSLQTCAEELAKVIADRVDRWGFALTSGYWKPVLQVEVAEGGQRRFEQLKRLLEGSGLEIQLASAPQAPRPVAK